jgi:hypothetical protein
MAQSPYGDMAYSQNYDNSSSTNKSSSAPYVLSGSVLGAGIGGYLGYRKNPYIKKDGKVVDSFAKNVYENYIDKAGESAKNAYYQGQNILKKINSVSSVDGFQDLLISNEEATKEICTELEHTPEEFLKNVTANNISANKQTIKERINAANKNRIQNIKNQIQACWNKKSNKFEQVDSVREEVFKSINKTAQGAKFKIIAKYAAISGALVGVAAYITHKILSLKSENN